MASRPQHSHDNGISERRLRPIYDWLDNSNNKKALQEADKVLKKSPSLQAARALKALALLRLGKTAEAFAVLGALAEEKPSDDTTLQAMTISYRESHLLEKVCELYENAIKSEPNNEELHSHLFMSYVRIGDHRSQQRVAMALYKIAPKNPYYFWAVMSIVLQAKSTDDKAKRGILLTLAQRMFKNFKSDNKIEAEQEARLYIMILDLQEKWQEIIDFLEGPLYSWLVPGSMPQASIVYLKKLKQWEKLNLLCKDLLLEDQDRWDYYLPYFDSVFELMKDVDFKGDSSTADNTPEKVDEFICMLLESVSCRRTLRGPYLARLEFCKRLLERGYDPTELLGSPFGLCVHYLIKFSHKPCAIQDLKPYLTMMPQKEREERCREFLKPFGYDEYFVAKNLDEPQQHINTLGLWRLCAPLPDLETSSHLAEVLRGHYLRCLRDGLVTSTNTEWSATDMYAVLAAHHYVYAAILSQSSKPIIDALSLLEMVLHKSPANFHVKLLLVQLYHLLGNALAADVIYMKLDIKHAQLVSLGWLHAARLTPACALQRALQLLSDTNSFYTHHAKDSVEHVTYAYKYGTWDKLVELEAWRRRVSRCAGAALAHSRGLTAAVAGPTPPLTPPDHVEQYTDNRDLTVILNWEPAQCADEEYKTRSFEQDVSFVKLRNIILQSLILSTELSESRPAEDKAKKRTCLQDCVEQFRTEWDRCRDKYKEREKIKISRPFPSRIIAFVNSQVPYRDLYSVAFCLVCNLSSDSDTCSSVCELLTRKVAESRDLIARAIEDRLRADDPAWFMREALEDLSNYLEFIGIITNIIGLGNDIASSKNTKKTKRKGQNQSAEEAKTSELLRALNKEVQLCIATIEQILDGWPAYVTENTLEEQFEQLNLSFDNPVPDRLKNGRNTMIADLKNMLKQKCKYLVGLCT